MPKVSNERKNLNRLAGEFLVASRFTQRGYMVSIQWGTAIGYDILVFDKRGKVVFLEVKSTAAIPMSWALQSKYAFPENSSIPLGKRYICCVDLSIKEAEPQVYVFPAKVVSKGLKYRFGENFPNSSTLKFDLNAKPVGQSKLPEVKTVYQVTNASKYLENYEQLPVEPVLQ